MSGRNPPSYCTLTLIAMQGHQQKGRQNSTSSNKKDKSNTIIETSTAEDHDDENLHNPETVQDAGIHLEVDEEHGCCCFLTLTDPLRIQPWSQDRRNQTKSNRESEMSMESRQKRTAKK